MPGVRLWEGRWAAAGASGLLCGLYALGGAGAWPLGFIALVPWLRRLDAESSWRGALLSAWAMSVVFTAAVFAWFGQAIGNYTQLGEPAGLALLLLGAPLFQPQFLALALVRHAVGRRHGATRAAICGAAAWVAAEWLYPKWLGDTLGHGLYPAVLLRQAADLGGAAGLTLLLLLANEAVRRALARRRDGARAWAVPLALAGLTAVLPAGYGLAVMPAPSTAAAGQPLRIGLVQSNITDYERLRREKGAGEVVREVLNTHFAMSYDAIERQHADAVLWSETVYPTTFGNPKSEAGAALDREILETVNAARVPFVFGTYDRDEAGEYNSAAFVAPGTGLLGHYRKTRLFLYSEALPAWIDSPWLRRLLPGAGAWQAGSGARVFPLRLADGREIPVLPLICLDDTDANLALDGARLGAQAILTMSNDAWFTNHPQGMALHQAVAAFRSIETRLPQFRVTTNGLSALIDTSGAIVAGSRAGERSLVVGTLPAAPAGPTLMLAWGDWVGRACAAFLALLALLAASLALRQWQLPADAPQAAATLPARVAVLPPAARVAAAALRVAARASLLLMAAMVLWGDGAWQAQPMAQIRSFAAFFVGPEVAAWCLLQAFSARAHIEQGVLVLSSGGRRLAVALRDVAAVEPWRLPLPGPGVSLHLANGQRWPYGLALPDAAALEHARLCAGGPPAPAPSARPSLTTLYAQARLAGWLGRAQLPLAKFVLLPLLLAVPAFRLHQHIAYGSSFGELLSFGLAAYLKGFALWWAAWAIGVALCAGVLRAAIEAGTLAALLLRPARAVEARRWLDALGLAALYLGLPAWLLMRLIAS